MQNEAECPSSHFHTLFDQAKYQVDDYSVTTEDGYVLKIWRIRLKQNLLQQLPNAFKNNINQPVMMQHGASMAADNWFINGEDKSLGFYLVNKGYDVWAGSNRGTKDCKTHINKNITSKEFYDFSFQEMGWFDLPAFYKLVLAQYNNQTKVIYVGHSQGTSQFMSAALDESTKKMVKDNTKKFIAIAPIAILTEMKEKAISVFKTKVVEVLEKFGVYELLSSGCGSPDYWPYKRLNQFCSYFRTACKPLVNALGGDPAIHNIFGRIDIMLSYYPSGYSIKSALHYEQLVYAKDSEGNSLFQAWDYGEKGNMEHYGQKTPIIWSFADWDIDTAFIAGDQDSLATPDNIAKLLQKIDKKYYTFSNIPGWGHTTPIIPLNPQPLYDLVDKALE